MFGHRAYPFFMVSKSRNVSYKHQVASALDPKRGAIFILHCAARLHEALFRRSSERNDPLFSKKCFPFSLLYQSPKRYYEIKKSSAAVSQKEVADIFMKAKSLKVYPKIFTVITNAHYSENVYAFVDEMRKESKQNSLGLIDGIRLTSMIRKSRMGKMIPKGSKKGPGRMSFEEMTSHYIKFIERYGAIA